MSELEVIVGSGITVQEAANNMRESFNAVDGDKRILRIETICRSMYCESVIWYTIDAVSQMQALKQQKRYIGMPEGTDPLNPTNN